MRLFGQQREKWVHLDQMFLLGSGGEGNVYPLLNDSAFAAKLFHKETHSDRADKMRAMLDNPHWGWHAAKVLGAEVARPKQYQRAAPKAWPGAMFAD